LLNFLFSQSTSPSLNRLNTINNKNLDPNLN
jgi:hypothetical protein